MAYFGNYDTQPAGFAGQVARGDQSLSRAWGETNMDTTNTPTGIFVAYYIGTDDTVQQRHGFRKITAATDTVHGIVVTTGMFKLIRPQERGSIMHIGHGDSVWAQMADGATLKRGDDVNIVATGDDAGKITNAAGIATQYIVVRVSDTIAEITRKEVVAAAEQP